MKTKPGQEGFVVVPDALASLQECRNEIAELVRDIIGARAANIAGSGHRRFDEASQKELARMEAILGRADAALAKASYNGDV
jgi:predicted translin family RNA/ssDNA-binding protein